MPEKIALIFDFDDTLAPDTVSGFLKFIGRDPHIFWKDKVDPLLDKGWDPATSYLYSLIQLSGELENGQKITRQNLIKYGKKIKFYNGVSTLFINLKDETRSIAAAKDVDVDVEFYVISSGIKDMLNATTIRKHLTELWGSNFHYDGKNEEISFPKNIISFTDKTRYLFQIAKGIFGPEYDNKPFEVNKKIDAAQYAVHFNRMIFVGDGYTDIPCFSLVEKNGGTAIAVFDKNRRDKWERAWRYSKDKRVTQLASTDYRKTSDLYTLLVMAIERMCNDILFETKTYHR